MTDAEANVKADAAGGSGTGKRWSPLGLVLLVLSVEAVAMILLDALLAVRAVRRGSAPQFLFSWIAPMVVGGEGRFLSLAKGLLLPALAIGLPALLAALMFRLRRGAEAVAASVRPSLAVAVVLLVLGIVGNGVLYRTLSARPKNEEVAVKPPKNGGEAPVVPTPPTTATGEERILFCSDRAGEGEEKQWHLWMMKPDGSGQEQLSKTDRIHIQPRLSPDGTKVAFSSGDAKGRHVVCLFDLATREEKEVCEGDQGAFTGDGKALVLRREDKIFRRDLGTGGEKQLSPAMWARVSYPSASPDGTGLAVASRLMAGYNIYILPMTGEGEPRLLIGGVGTCDPRWAPSGKQLSYQTETHIFTIKPDGKDKTQVTWGGGVQHYACFSPDEKKMAYCQGPGPNGPWQIYAVALDKEEDPVVLAKEGSCMYPEWGFLKLGK